LTAEYTRAVGDLAREHGLRLHLDGARIFNAAAALEASAADLAAPADSITFCLSKGLSAPVGSLLCGSHDFIQRAHRIRKQLGGGMRQAGVLAAAGIVALETMAPRLAEDHRRARQLAQGLSQIPGLFLIFGTPRTNMVFLGLSEDIPISAHRIAGRLEDRGIRVQVTSPRSFRLVTHYWVGDEATSTVIEAFREVIVAH
jgi:threonine aldolase